jgi:adhesin transport system outer membrane protein
VAATQLGVTREMQNDYRDYTNALHRLASQQQSLQGAEKVLASYQRQFQVGRKSWLDLLNAARELSQSQYALADTHALLESALYRLKLRTQHPSLFSDFSHKKPH